MIRLDRAPGRWTLTIDRPEKANSLTRAMLEDLAGAVEAAAAAKVPVLVLTGTGKVFSAGADLDEARAGLARDGVWERLSGAIAGFPGLSIAALNGTLAGGAFGMALACDLRIAVPGARFFYPAIRLGFLPQPSDAGRLIALLGPARAKLILMAGQKLSAEEALSFGLIDRIVDPQALGEAVDALAEAAETARPEVREAIKGMFG